MYRRILIPIDRSEESERVFGAIKAQLAPDGEVIFLHVIPPTRARLAREDPRLAGMFEELDRYDAFDYFRGFVDRLGDQLGWWRCDVAIAESISDCIVDFAQDERADLIAMCTHRNACERLVTRDVASQVAPTAAAELRILQPWELPMFPARTRLN